MPESSEILKAKILIVDDLPANVLLLERMLGEAGYQSITSTLDPHAVRALHEKNRYDLILLDLQMPGMDGFQVMEGLKEIETAGYLPVLVITAQPDHKLRALRAGAMDFISKPFESPKPDARPQHARGAPVARRNPPQNAELKSFGKSWRGKAIRRRH
jgi:CheY-like chemotaxis protein